MEHVISTRITKVKCRLTAKELAFKKLNAELKTLDRFNMVMRFSLVCITFYTVYSIYMVWNS